jgi:hypothetical protein
LRWVHSSAQGSASVACWSASLLLTTHGTGTARSGKLSLFAFSNVILKVWSSTAENCSPSTKEPAAIWIAGKPPAAIARSNDQRTSSAVTGLPSWKVAPWRILKTIVLPSSTTSQLSASSGSNVAAS